MTNWSTLIGELAPHGYCLSWQPHLLWLHGVADAVTAVAYYSIPAMLLVFVRRRSDLQFSWIFVLFGVFIMACGATHVMSLWTLWRPDYLAAGVVKAVTALVSIATAGALIPLLPKALALPGPAQWEAVNAKLRGEIAERRQAEDEVRRLNDALEMRVAERTAALEAAYEELRASQAAEAASRARSEFLAVMSHELRTPLNAILGYTQLLRRAPDLPERQATGLATIEQSGQHLLTLINDLLDLAKIEAGKFSLAPAPMNLAPAVDVIADIVRIKAEEKSLRFVCDTSFNLPQAVLADEKRLRQVLLNLLGNAVKFTDRGQVGLKAIPLLGAPTGTTLLRFEVVDTGIGMTPDQLATIFEPFEQAGDAQRRAGGTGLGLSISRELVRQMGGDIHVESRIGIGSRFWFEIALPLAEPVPAAASAQGSATGYEGPRRKLLVADDVVGNRALLADLLGDLGFDLCEAVNGREAVERAQTERPDLVLMDLVMPEWDGIEAIRRIRAVPGLERLPIVAVSASANQDDRAAAVAAGADAFLPKPLDHERLLQAIGTALQLSWRYDAAPAQHADAANAAVFAPPAAELDALHLLALAGDLRAIRRQAERLAAADARYAPFTAILLRLAAAYRSKALLDFVAGHLPRGATS